MPLFHAAALYNFFYGSIYRNITTILGIGEKPLTADIIIECLDNVNYDGILLPPSILEDASHSEEYMSKLSRLGMVVVGGGRLRSLPYYARLAYRYRQSNQKGWR